MDNFLLCLIEIICWVSSRLIIYTAIKKELVKLLSGSIWHGCPAFTILLTYWFCCYSCWCCCCCCFCWCNPWTRWLFEADLCLPVVLLYRQINCLTVANANGNKNGYGLLKLLLQHCTVMIMTNLNVFTCKLVMFSDKSLGLSKWNM